MGTGFWTHLTACENRQVLQVVLPVLAESGRLDGAQLGARAQLVDDQRCEGLALDVSGHDQQAALALEHVLQQRNERRQPAGYQETVILPVTYRASRAVSACSSSVMRVT